MTLIQRQSWEVLGLAHRLRSALTQRDLPLARSVATVLKVKADELGAAITLEYARKDARSAKRVAGKRKKGVAHAR